MSIFSNRTIFLFGLIVLYGFSFSCVGPEEEQVVTDTKQTIITVVQHDTIFLPLKREVELGDLLKLYVKSNGSDSASGLSYQEAVYSLERVQDILKYLTPTTDVEIHINQGTYYNQEVEWTFVNGHDITFTAIDFSAERPVFDGLGSETWFNLAVGEGEDTNLSFLNLTLKNYKLGIGLRGNRDEFEKGWNGNNIIRGMRFEQIGSLYTLDKSWAYSAINMVNSRRNIIEDSYFIDIENETDKGIVHALYFAHYSSHNLVRNCLFVNNSGDPIRVRDESNFNIIDQNIFIDTGYRAYYSEWYCTKQTAGNWCSKPAGEHPSYGNEFTNNDCQGGFHQEAIPLTSLEGIDTHCGETPVPRVCTENNQIAAPLQVDSMLSF